MAGGRHRRPHRGLAACALALGALLAAPAVAPAQPGCDPLDGSACLLPWPNDLFTVADPTTDTGLRVHLARQAMPRDISGRPIDPTAWNRSDGFSPGSLIVTHVPGLDTPQAFARTGAVPISDVARALDRDQPVVVINAQTGRRQLIWSELDTNPANPADRDLLIRPAVNLDEGARYIVALRHLRDAAGRPIPAGPAFRVYRDRLPSSDPDVEARRAHMEQLFATLARAGIARKDLYLAWDFTVASERGLAERMLHIRDDAFARLGDRNLADMRVDGRAPDFVVTKVENLGQCEPDGCHPGEDDHVFRRVEGRVMVPCYLDRPGCPPGSQFLYDDAGMPMALPGNVHAAHFVCNIPRSAVANGAVHPGRPSLYGHGLLGSAEQVSGRAIRQLADEHDFVMCATDWSGMSEEDLANDVEILSDLSRFPTLADRGQQGMLNFLYLGRLMIHPAGLSSDRAFQYRGRPVIDMSRLYYDGGSQGGIMGGSLTAVAPDFDRAALGVPGMNYSTLLRRSVDFDSYAQVMYTVYPNELERPLILSLIQMLWDRAEADGYAHHMTDDPYPNTPPHRVLLDMAFGDHQVTNWATVVEARTVGARLRVPALDPGRSPERRPYFGVRRMRRFPFEGSALMVWDVGPLRTVRGRIKGTPPPPTEEVPNRPGVDPHGPDASETIGGRNQISAFLRPGGWIIDPCGPLPCYLDGWTGRPGS